MIVRIATFYLYIDEGKHICVRVGHGPDRPNVDFIFPLLFAPNQKRTDRHDVAFPFFLPDRLWKYVVHILFTFGKLMEFKSDRKY